MRTNLLTSDKAQPRDTRTGSMCAAGNLGRDVLKVPTKGPQLASSQSTETHQQETQWCLRPLGYDAIWHSVAKTLISGPLLTDLVNGRGKGNKEFSLCNKEIWTVEWTEFGNKLGVAIIEERRGTAKPRSWCSNSFEF